MKDLTDLNRFRVKDADILRQFGSVGDETCGAFMIPYPRTGVTLKCLASSDAGSGWDHVSVSLPNRCPNWFEMQHIHRVFFKKEETAWEYHVNEADHVNVHPYVLHIWRKHSFVIPMPPKEFV
jgi:hypothetical protein